MNLPIWLLVANLSLPWQLAEHHQVIDQSLTPVAGECNSQTKPGQASAPLMEATLPETFELVVWNIYKQQRPELLPELAEIASRTDVLVLQEVVNDRAFQQLVSNVGLLSQQTVAFKTWRDDIYNATGVSTLARIPARWSCGWWAAEPWLPVPKTGLLTVYPLASGDDLWLVNLHAINFTLGVNDYQQQLNQIKALLKRHSGPIIVSGDFNSWREKRHDAIQQLQKELALKAVNWQPDERVQFFGQPVDHILYRGLTLDSANIKATLASDHHPLRARFKLK